MRGLALGGDAEDARAASAGRRQVVICATVHGASPARALSARLCWAEPPQAPRAHAAALAPRARAVLRGPRPRLLYRRERADTSPRAHAPHKDARVAQNGRGRSAPSTRKRARPVGGHSARQGALRGPDKGL